MTGISPLDASGPVLASNMSTLARLASYNAAERNRRAQHESAAALPMQCLLEEGRSGKEYSTIAKEAAAKAVKIKSGLIRVLFAFALCLVMAALLYLIFVDPGQLRRILEPLSFW
ncbi:hypothetical protein LTR86_001260 [Recurvomyces mirabilis]|nr:hypothetical protein LTR86_001260 [Recurvomyces mirabilis]